MASLTPSFIAISETKLKAASFCNIEIPGYTFIHNPSSTNAGGVGLYIQSNIVFSHRNDLELKVEGCESLFIEVKSQLKKPCILVSSTDTQVKRYKIFKLNYQILLNYKKKIMIM